MTVRLNLALQGGGAHGAFTWGVLDRLLEEGDRFAFEGVSGASAGAMNGAVLVDGLLKGGHEGARAALDDFWHRIGLEARTSPFQPTPLDRLLGHHNIDHNPAWIAFDAATRLLSPYQFNPFDLHPLRHLLPQLIDFAALQQAGEPRLYISATEVRRGRLKIFANREICAEALLASACLPNLFRAIEIDGTEYWDGGFMGNPTLYPLIHACGATDIVIVQVNPVRRETLPTDAPSILDRMAEISFNATMQRELAGLELINRLLEDRQLDAQCGLARKYVHLIGDETAMAAYGASSKFNADAAFLAELKAHGRAAASRWLTGCAPRLGKESTLDPSHSSA